MTEEQKVDPPPATTPAGLPSPRDASLPIESILVDPEGKHGGIGNVARGCTSEPLTHPDIRKVTSSIREGKKLYQPVSVRKLAAPKIVDGKSYAYELVAGYRRMASCIACGWTKIAAVDHGVIPDLEAVRINMEENGCRGNATDYQIAHGMLLLAEKWSLTHTDIARISQSKANYVESMINIVKRCPKELLDQWKVNSTPAYKRALERLSRIEGVDEADRHRKMMDEWRRFIEERDNPAGYGASSGGFIPRGPRAMGRREIERLRARVDEASEVLDATGWRPISDDERQTLHAVLRHVAEPAHTKNPLR